MAIRVEQHVGLEPTHAAWKAAGLPITQVLHNDSAPVGLRVHPTVLLTKIAAGSYPDHSNVSIANRVSLAERRGLEPLRRCRRSRISNPAPYLLGQRSMIDLAMVRIVERRGGVYSCFKDQETSLRRF